MDGGGQRGLRGASKTLINVVLFRKIDIQQNIY